MNLWCNSCDHFYTFTNERAISRVANILCLLENAYNTWSILLIAPSHQQLLSSPFLHTVENISSILWLEKMPSVFPW